MAAESSPKIVSANELLGGAVVYFTKEGGWSERPEDARVAVQAAAELLEEAERQPGAVVGPYLVDVRLDARGLPAPVHIRERIRMNGPTVARANHGAAGA